MQKKCTFYADFDKNICLIQKKAVPLRRIFNRVLLGGTRKNTRLADLEGYMQRLLRQFKNIPITSSVLQAVLPQRASFTHFISNLVDTNQLIRIKRGLYIVSPDVSGVPINTMMIANSLYGPSYVSFSTALNYYGLIDDVSQGIYSASIKRDKHYLTPVGRFEYIAVPASYYAVGIKQIITNDYSFLIATPEKALCDTIVNTPGLNLRSQKDAMTYLEEDLRFDIDELKSLDISILQECAACGVKSNSIQQIIKLIQS